VMGESFAQGIGVKVPTGTVSEHCWCERC
jgi:hypothetical protein